MLGMWIDTQLRPRRTLRFEFAGLVLIVVLAGCGGPGASGAPGSEAGPFATSVIPADHPLVGAWTTDVTKADLQASGIADAGLLNENSGRFTWTFAPDGTWTQIQQSLDGSPIRNPVIRGTYTVEGGTLIAKTDFPEEYKDNGLHFTWAIEGDEVRFHLLDPPDPMLPILIETHPWRRSP